MSEKAQTRCEECENYLFDEETEEYYCDAVAVLDEDEYGRLSAGACCPLFRFNNEYRIVHKQN